MKRVLFLAYHFPPVGGGGVQRNAKFTRYLPDFSYEPVVVTGPGDLPGRWTPRDETLLHEIPPGTEIHRIPGPAPRASSGWRRRAERLLTLSSPHSRWWVEKAAQTGLEVGRSVDVIYASLAPYETALTGARLSRELGKPWVADLQDPWALDEMWLYPSGLHRQHDLARMRRLLSTAAAVVMNTPEAASRVRRHLPELKEKPVVTITNGFDESDFPDSPDVQDASVFRIVHTGYLYASEGKQHRRTRTLRQALRGTFAGVDMLTRSHVFVLDAISRLVAEDSSLEDALEVHLAGVLSEADRDVARRYPFVRVRGYLPHRDSVALLRSATLLFLPMHDLPSGMRAGLVPGKTFEYLASGRPILAAVPDGDARDLLETVPGVATCRPADTACMADVLRARIREWRAGKVNANFTRELAAFERRALTRRLAELFSAVTVADPRA